MLALAFTHTATNGAIGRTTRPAPVSAVLRLHGQLLACRLLQCRSLQGHGLVGLEYLGGFGEGEICQLDVGFFPMHVVFVFLFLFFINATVPDSSFTSGHGGHKFRIWPANTLEWLQG